MTPHALRHAIATHLLRSGMTLEEIARLLGHRSLESTQRYTHLAHAMGDTEEQEGKSTVHVVEEAFA